MELKDVLLTLRTRLSKGAYRFHDWARFLRLSFLRRREERTEEARFILLGLDIEVTTTIVFGVLRIGWGRRGLIGVKTFLDYAHGLG